MKQMCRLQRQTFAKSVTDKQADGKEHSAETMIPISKLKQYIVINGDHDFTSPFLQNGLVREVRTYEKLGVSWNKCVVC